MVPLTYIPRASKKIPQKWKVSQVFSLLQVVLEGVTLAFHEYKLVTSATDPNKAKDLSKFGKGTTDLLDILKEVREKKQAISKNVNAIVDDYGDWFLDLTDRVKLPEWFDPEKEDVGQAVKLLDWMLDVAAVLYVESDQVNDFFYLHGVTGIF